MRESSHRAEEGHRGGKGGWRSAERDREGSEHPRGETNDERHARSIPGVAGEREGERGVFHFVGRKGDGPFAGAGARCEKCD